MGCNVLPAALTRIIATFNRRLTDWRIDVSDTGTSASTPSHWRRPNPPNECENDNPMYPILLIDWLLRVLGGFSWHTRKRRRQGRRIDGRLECLIGTCSAGWKAAGGHVLDIDPATLLLFGVSSAESSSCANYARDLPPKLSGTPLPSFPQIGHFY